ncbi:MAG: hypothetical protein ABIF88_01240 [archaeon]
MEIRVLMIFFVGIILISFASSVAVVDFSCPESVNLNEEFVCSLEVLEGDGVYDVKLQIEDGGNSVARLWNSEDETWKSSWYYLIGFIGVEEKKDIRVKIEKSGDYDSNLILRLGKNREFFEFSISVSDDEIVEVSDENEDSVDSEVDEEEVIEEVQEEEVQKSVDENRKTTSEEKEVKVISLNSNVVLDNSSSDNPEVVYESKNKKIVDYAPYVFSIFLLAIIVVLFWEKF